MSVPDNLGGIDAQHRQLAERGRAICDLVRDRGSYPDLASALTRFLELTRIHFSEEENLMRRYGYEGYDSHKKTHGLLLRRLEEITAETLSGFKPSTEESLLDFLKHDVCYHIIEDTHAWEKGEIDKRFACQRVLNQAVAAQE